MPVGAKQSLEAKNAILNFCRGDSVKEAAEKAGITPATLYRWIEKSKSLTKMLPMSREDRAKAGLMQDQKRASNTVAQAILDGRLVRQPCQECGQPTTFEKQSVAHHPDYSRPLDVVWLCDSCHCQLHGQMPSLKKLREDVTK
jgi:transposase-like protein